MQQYQMHCWCNTEKFASASEDQLSGGVLYIYMSKHPTKQRDHEKEGLCTEERSQRSGYRQMTGNG